MDKITSSNAALSAMAALYFASTMTSSSSPPNYNYVERSILSTNKAIYDSFSPVETSLCSNSSSLHMLTATKETNEDMNSNFELKNFKLKKSYSFSVEYEDGFFMIDDEYLDIHVYEKNKEELIKSLSQELVFIYNAYAKEKDENLTAGAIKLKHKIIDLMEEV